jgi:hypothetical protein
MAACGKSGAAAGLRDASGLIVGLGELAGLSYMLQVGLWYGEYLYRLGRCDAVGGQALLSAAVEFLRRRWVEPHGTPESLLQPAGDMLRYLRRAWLRHFGHDSAAGSSP